MVFRWELPECVISLPSRDIIADSIETVVQAMSYDGVVTVVGCDKNMQSALKVVVVKVEKGTNDQKDTLVDIRLAA